MASFRDRNEGKKYKDGKKKKPNWEYRIYYTERKTGKQKELSKAGFKTKAEAKAAAIEEESKINYYGFSENGTELVSTYFDKWLEVFKKPYVKPITYTIQERNVRLNILPRWGNYKLNEITRVEYQQWITELREHYTEGTVRRIHSIMSTAINDAVHEFNIMRENPLQKIKIPKQEEHNKLQFFTREQLELFLYATKPVKNTKYQHSIQYQALFTLLARTGLRIGEALALTWDDLDTINKTITVSKTLVYPLNSTPYISTPKSKKSNRTIKLDNETFKLIDKKHRLNQKEVILMYENYKASKDNLMFHQQDGRWLRTNVVREYFKEVCKRANLPVLSPHALRHTHAVHLLEAGANLKYVSERLGHASVKVTADTYLHVTEKIEDDALDLYSNYVSKKPGQKTGKEHGSDQETL